MAPKPKTILLDGKRNVHQLLDSACHQPLILDRGGVRFRLELDPDDLSAYYDPEAVRHAFEKFAGIWADLDIEEMIADLRRAREEGSRPLNHR